MHPRHVTEITLSPDSSDVPVGETVHLTATLSNRNGDALEQAHIRWKSSDSTIAQVDASGLVSGIATGTVTISASSQGTSGSARVRVVGHVAELNLSCDPSPIRLEQGSVGTISCMLSAPPSFSGTVTVRGEQLPAGVVIRQLDASPIELQDGFRAIVFLDVEVAPTTITGHYDARITASGEEAGQTIVVPLEVANHGPTVHMVYLLPSDVEYDPRVALGMDHAIRHLQIWYQRDLDNGKTFSIGFPLITVLHSTHPASYFATSSWTRATSEVFAALGGGFFSQTDIWNIYLPVVTDGQGGAPGVALLGENDVLGISGEDTGGYTIARWVGGLGHELGHALGLPHPPGCVDGDTAGDCASLMYLGYLYYPNTFLTAADRIQLDASPFFSTSVTVTNRLFNAGVLGLVQ
ncbi:MAG TPA: Ig-like domain-containing protein [Gemmatimonadaceae bacterium]|nr:Ig-like domain-containing protein [Gemmatimonadaceae bacterium]